MAGPWEKYQTEQQPPKAGPWVKYANPAQQGPKGSWRDAPIVAPTSVESEEVDLLRLILEAGEATLNTTGYWAEAGAKMGTEMLGAPVNLVNASPMLLNLLPGEQGMTPFSDRPIGGSEHLWDLLIEPRDAAQRAMGVTVGDDVPENVVERVGGRIVGELVAASIPGMATLNKASMVGSSGARAMQESSRRGERMLGSLLEGAAANPKNFVTKEALYAGSAGAGAGVSRELVSDGDPTTTTTPEAVADVVGSVAGVGATAGVSALKQTAGDIFTSATGRGGSELVRDAVTNEIARASGAPIAPSGAPDTEVLANALRGGSAVPERVPGYRETTADVLQNPGVASLEYS